MTDNIIAPGVQQVAPPRVLVGSIRDSIDEACRSIPPGKNGALVVVGNERGANLAVVSRLGPAWTVEAWIAKSWHVDGPEYGARVTRAW